MRSIFVTGTDTEIGKTVVASGIVRAANLAGKNAVGLKPVAAGCDKVDGKLRNEDAMSLIDAANLKLPYETVNPIALAPAIAPHIAAEQANLSISASILKLHYERNLVEDLRLDLAVYEGAGGWFVPLNDYETFQDFVLAMQLDVVLVVGMKLGCINHALLTERAIKTSGLSFVGWVANFAEPAMDVANENLETLMQRLGAPLLGVVPNLKEPVAEEVAKHLNINVLIA